MKKENSFLFIYILLSLITRFSRSENVNFTFPTNFLIGTSTSAFQVEGAWNHSDKGESIWDYYTHKFPNKIKDHSNADVACDSYHKYKEDVRLLKEIGLDHYRFSLSWSRILPTGFIDNVSKTGVEYYHNLLDELKKYNIEPIVTIYHFEHPQSLEMLGGWLNENMAYWYADYAKFVFEEFGDKIKYFSTMNEISMMCLLGYGKGEYAPGINSSGSGEYICAHNMLKGHALVYHIYDEKFREQQKGQIGIAELCQNYYNKDEKDSEAKEIAFAFGCGWILNPIFSENGNYPEHMIRRIEERSKLQQLNSSRLPTFSKDWITYIKGTSDFLGLNHYTSYIVSQLPREEQLDWPDDSGIEKFDDPEWEESPVFKVVPKGLGDILRKLKAEYNNPPVFILENGVASDIGTNDDIKAKHLYMYMKEMLIAIKRDKCNVKMYTIWSFMDSFEWLFGYSFHFGLVDVDFKDKNLKRTPKNSVSWLKSVLQTRELLPPSLKK